MCKRFDPKDIEAKEKYFFRLTSLGVLQDPD